MHGVWLDFSVEYWTKIGVWLQLDWSHFSPEKRPKLQSGSTSSKPNQDWSLIGEWITIVIDSRMDSDWTKWSHSDATFPNPGPIQCTAPGPGSRPGRLDSDWTKWSHSDPTLIPLYPIKIALWCHFPQSRQIGASSWKVLPSCQAGYTMLLY